MRRADGPKGEGLNCRRKGSSSQGGGESERWRSGLVLLAVGCAGDRPERTAGQSIDDQAIARRVEEALRADPSYKFADVKVAAYEGKVQLSGFVAKGEQKGHAEDIAKKVPGVKEVKNDIALK